MTADQVSYLLLIILAMHVTFFALSGIVLFAKNREQHDRSRVLFGVVCSAYALCAAVFIANAFRYDSLSKFFHSILELYPSIFALPIFLLIPAYVLEVLRPNWLKLTRFLLILSPWLVTCLAFFVWYTMQGETQTTITPLFGWNELFLSIHQPDVIFRLVFVLFYILYACSIFLIPYDPQHSNVSLSWRWVLRCLTVLIAVGFVVGVQFRITEVMIAYWVVVDTMIGVVLYLELRIRIPVPEEPQHVVEITPITEDVHTAPLSVLAHNLQVLLDNGIWQNPEVCREDICKELGTNRMYLSGAIHELGYENFAEMINLHRMRYVEQQLEQLPTATITDLLFQAGYRNRTSAIRHFSTHFGVAPSEYTNYCTRQKCSEK